MLAYWNAPNATTPADAQDVFFRQADDWFRRASYGRYGLQGVVTPWMAIAGPDEGLCWTNMSQIMSQAKSSAMSLGFDTAAFDRTVVYFPAASAVTDCSNYSGWADRPGTNVWINGELTLRNVVHELGHNLGLTHAHSLACTTPTALAAFDCPTVEYGDPSDPMGSDSTGADYQARDLEYLGWLEPSRVTTISTSQTVNLVPVVNSTGLALAEVTVSPTRKYILEHRSRVGLDANLPAGLAGGLLIRVVDTALGLDALIDTTPATPVWDAQVPAGGKWTSPEGVGLSVGTDRGSGLSVSVKFPRR